MARSHPRPETGGQGHLVPPGGDRLQHEAGESIDVRGGIADLLQRVKHVQCSLAQRRGVHAPERLPRRTTLNPNDPSRLGEPTTPRVPAPHAPLDNNGRLKPPLP